MNERGVRGVDPNGTPSLPPDDDDTRVAITKRFNVTDGVRLEDVQWMIDRLTRADREALRVWMAGYDERGASAAR